MHLKELFDFHLFVYTLGHKFFSACAMTEGNAEDKINAFSSVLTALIGLQDMDHLHADAYTWPAVWKACESLLDVKRDLAWINRIFELTIKSGHVNKLLFNNMRRFLPQQYLQKKLKTDLDVYQITVHDLPSEWTCNVKLGPRDEKRHGPRGMKRSGGHRNDKKKSHHRNKS